MTYDNPVVDDAGLVIDFDRNGVSILEYTAPEVGVAVTKNGVTAQVLTVFHRQAPDGTWGTTLVIEVDNTTSEMLDGSWDALLVGSDRGSANPVAYTQFDYPANAISKDVMIFTGVEDLTEGGELRISLDYDTQLIVEIPQVPASN
jgi:hypothetical protein